MIEQRTSWSLNFSGLEWGSPMPNEFKSHSAAILQRLFQISLYPVDHFEERDKNLMFLQLQQWKRGEERMDLQFIQGRAETNNMYKNDCTESLCQTKQVLIFFFFLISNVFDEKWKTVGGGTYGVRNAFMKSCHLNTD